MREWFCDNILKPMFSIFVSQFHKRQVRIALHFIRFQMQIVLQLF